MDSNQKGYSQSEPNDDDFLSGDNASRPYPNQNNPNEGYNKQFSPGSKNPNIGGDESGGKHYPLFHWFCQQMGPPPQQGRPF